MSVRLDRVDVRAKLKPRRDPYWHRLAEGRYLGFRKMKAGATGTWLARYYDGEKYQPKSLEAFAALLEKDRFDAAKRAAEAWFQHLNMGGSTDCVSVKTACAAYIEKLRQEKGDASADDTEGRFRRLVYDDPIGPMDLSKLAPRHFAEWKKRVLSKARHRTTRARARSTYNRDLGSFRAALNLAVDRREVVSNHAWAKELRQLKLDENESRRTLYLSRDERRKLLGNGSEEVKPLLTALAMLPLRPGEQANAKVSDFDARRGLLRVSGKTGSREVPLSGAAVEHFKACARDKLPSAWLISRLDGAKWDRFAWNKQIKHAAACAGLPAATVLYTLRHSTITDLVTGGLDLFTVAKISGTSVKMIDKHYGQLQQERAKAALETLALA